MTPSRSIGSLACCYLDEGGGSETLHRQHIYALLTKIDHKCAHTSTIRGMYGNSGVENDCYKLCYPGFRPYLYLTGFRRHGFLKGRFKPKGKQLNYSYGRYAFTLVWLTQSYLFREQLSRKSIERSRNVAFQDNFWQL